MGGDVRCRSMAVSSCKSTGDKAVADSPVVVKASAGILRGFTAYTDGTNDVTVTAYDNASSAAGTILSKVIVHGADDSGGLIGIDVEAANGIVVTISGTGGHAIVYYI